MTGEILTKLSGAFANDGKWIVRKKEEVMSMKTTNKMLLSCASAALLIGASPVAAQEAMPSQAEMWKMLQTQASEIKALRDKLEGVEEEVEEVAVVQSAQDQTISRITNAPVRQMVEEDDFAPVGSTEYGYGDSGLGRITGDATAGRFGNTVLGSYGELNYNNNSNSDSRIAEIDQQRFVAYIGHEFNDRLRFFSEIEIEHTFIQDRADGGTPGQVSVEQAFLQLDLTEQVKLNAGILLMPLGIINEIHEPTTFFGVERNPIEAQIIPSTYREAGLGLQGRVGDTGFSYDALITTGLNVTGVSSSGGGDARDVVDATGSSPFDIRGSRTQAARTRPVTPAYTGRVKYTGVPGLELAAAVSYNVDITQGAPEDIDGDGVADLNESVDAVLFSAHIDYLRNGFGLRALYAQNTLGGSLPKLTGEDEQRGYYIEPSYRFELPGSFGVIDDLGTLGVFVRYEDIDEHAGSLGGNQGFSRTGFGVNYWPHPGIVFKADFFDVDRENGRESETFNLGVGYSF